MVIVETSVFTKQIQKILADEAYRYLQAELANRPDLGAIIPGSGGLRKVRWGLTGQGKRGGIRVIYYWVVAQERLLMLLVYPKNMQDNLSPAQLKLLRQTVEEMYP